MCMRSKHAAFVGWYHILDVDVGILAPVLLQYLQSFLNKIRHVLVLSLSIIDLVPDVHYFTNHLQRLFLNMLNTGKICL